MLGTSSSELSGLFGAGSGIWNLGGNILAPIFRGGEIKGQVKEAEAIQKQALYAYVGAVQNAFRDAEVALSDRSRTALEYAAQAKREAALTTYADLARMRYREGVTDYMEVLDAERALFSTQLDRAQTQGTLYKSVVGVYRALAGGWLDSAAAGSFLIEPVTQ
jgi:multidrug efflux system outer membrane protein